MLYNRRNFLSATGLAFGGAALGRLGLVASLTPDSAKEREVSDVLSRYGKSVRTTRKRGEATQFMVKVRSPEHFKKVFDPQNLPFERIYVGPNNTLHVNHRGVTFTIVNVA